jgi:hypothetical protein
MLTVTAASGFGATVAVASFDTLGAYFDGSNDYMLAEPLNSGADGTVTSGSVWVNVDSLSNDPNFFTAEVSTESMPQSFIGSDGSIGINIYQDAGNYYYAKTSSTGLITTGAGWQHIAWRIISNPFSLVIYVDGAAKGTTTAASAGSGFTMDNTNARTYIGSARNPPGGKMQGDMAENYVNIGVNLDWSDSATMAKFRSAAGGPVDLGTDGSIPTGAAPDIYCSLRPGDSAADFKTNRGAGNDFVITGALVLSSTNPGD